jgi:hypothetical protein
MQVGLESWWEGGWKNRPINGWVLMMGIPKKRMGLNDGSGKKGTNLDGGQVKKYLMCKKPLVYYMS